MIIFQISETGKSKSVPKLHEMSEIGMYFCSRNTYIPPTSVIFFLHKNKKMFMQQAIVTVMTHQFFPNIPIFSPESIMTAFVFFRQF